MQDPHTPYPVSHRASAHRPVAIRLPEDAKLATATVLAHIQGSEPTSRAAAMEALTARVAELTDADPDDAIVALGEQLPVLNALFLRFAVESVNAKTSEARGAFLRLSLSAQASYSRTQALVIGLRAQGEGRARVVLEDDS
jgi:hypothetical protein